MAPTDLSIKLHLYVLVHSTQQQDTRELPSTFLCCFTTSVNMEGK